MSDENLNLNNLGDVDEEGEDLLDLADIGEDFDRDNNQNQKQQQSQQQTQGNQTPQQEGEPGLGQDASKPVSGPETPEPGGGMAEPGFGQDASKVGKGVEDGAKGLEQSGKKGMEEAGKKGAQQAEKQAAKKAEKQAAKKLGEKALKQGAGKLLGTVLGGSVGWWVILAVIIVLAVIAIIVTIILIFAALAYSVPKDNNCDVSGVNNKVYELGDSLTGTASEPGMYQYLKNNLTENGWDPTIEGKASRFMVDNIPAANSGLDQAKKDRDIISQSDSIVIELGTNGCSTGVSTFKNQMETLYKEMKSYRPTARFYWVNFAWEGAECGSHMTEKNRALDEFATEKNITVIDWASVGKQYLSNDVHPNGDGYKKMAGLVSTALGEYHASGGSGGGTSKVPCLYQTDPRWANVVWGGHGTMASSACGLTSMAMAISAWEGKIVTPPQLAKKIGEGLNRSDQCHTNGLDWTCIDDIPTLYGLPKAVSLGKNFNKAKDYLKQGIPVISSYAGCSSCVWTDGGHFILLTGLTADGKVIVNDPYDPSKATGRTGPWCNKAVPVSWVDGTKDPIGSGFYAIVGKPGQIIPGAGSGGSSTDCPADGSTGAGSAEKVITTAKSQLGVPYVYGGCHVDYKNYPPPKGCQTDSNYDCSGFTGWSWYWGTDKEVNFGGGGATDQCNSDR